MASMVLSEESPLGPDLAVIFASHQRAMLAGSPADCIHMLPAEGLNRDDIRFFVLREAGLPVAMGALRQLSTEQGEVKSMHVLPAARGRGLSKLMTGHLIAKAEAMGMKRLWLETGTSPSFAPALGLYRAMGFRECGPFGDYEENAFSCFMTRELSRNAAA